MFLLLVTIPAMLLAIAIAIVPLLLTMAADRRRAVGQASLGTGPATAEVSVEDVFARAA